jgi:hypothetical protein
MPFLTQCVFCNHQVEAPDRALGASGRCPKCSNWFTVVPVAAMPRAAGPSILHHAVVPPAAPGMPPAPAAPPQRLANPPSGPGAPEASALAGLPPPLTEVPCTVEALEEEDGKPPAPRWVDPVGLAALLLGVASLLSASAPRLCGAVVPLAALTLLTGLAGLLLALARERSRLLFPIAGSAMGGAIVGVALLFPGLLGPAYRAFRERDARSPTAIRAVPLPGHSAGDQPEAADWVDASRAALQQNRLRVQVAGASVGPLEARPARNIKAKPEEGLFIRLRVHQAEGGAEFAAAPRGADGPAERPQPTLTDNTGKVYAPRAAPEGAEGVDQSVRFPVTVLDEIFVFEPPPPGLEFLRLEVPVAAWGGTGTFRFTIPADMIVRPAARAGAGPRGGS